MNIRGTKTVSLILNRSPIYKDLTMEEKEHLINDLLQTYPHLIQQDRDDEELGYEASWLNRKH